MPLVERDPSFQENQSACIKKLAKEIDEYTSSMVGVSFFDQRLEHLTGIVHAASELAVELARQRMLFIFQKPESQTFIANSMIDVQQVVTSVHLEGSPIQCVVFPEVLRYGNDLGQGFEHPVLVSKAVVLTGKTLGASEIEIQTPIEFGDNVPPRVTSYHRSVA